MLAAVQSTEVAEEHENYSPVGPFVTELVCDAGVIGEGEFAERGKVHVRHTIHI